MTSWGPRDYRTEDSPRPRARRFPFRADVRFDVLLAEEDFACAEVTDAGEDIEHVPTPLGETERQPMARADDDDARIGDDVIVIAVALEQAALRLSLLRDHNHSVTTFGQRFFVRSVIRRTAVAIHLAVDHRAMRVERRQVVRGEQ